jgi:hypothetical protein
MEPIGESSKAGWTTEAFMLGEHQWRKLTEILLDSTNTTKIYRKWPNFSLCFTNCKRNQLYLGMLTVSPQLQNGGIGAQLFKLIYMQNNWVF